MSRSAHGSPTSWAATPKLRSRNPQARSLFSVATTFPGFHFFHLFPFHPRTPSSPAPAPAKISGCCASSGFVPRRRRHRHRHRHLYHPLSFFSLFSFVPVACPPAAAACRLPSAACRLRARLKHCQHRNPTPDLFAGLRATKPPTSRHSQSRCFDSLKSNSTQLNSAQRSSAHPVSSHPDHHHRHHPHLPTTASLTPTMSAVRATALRAGGACVRCRKGKTKCVYENGRAPCKNCAKGLHECYLPSESMSHGGHGVGVSPARVAQRSRESLPTERASNSTAAHAHHADRHGQSHSTAVTSRNTAPANEKYVLCLSVCLFVYLFLWLAACRQSCLRCIMHSSIKLVIPSCHLHHHCCRRLSLLISHLLPLGSLQPTACHLLSLLTNRPLHQSAPPALRWQMPTSPARVSHGRIVFQLLFFFTNPPTLLP